METEVVAVVGRVVQGTWENCRPREKKGIAIKMPWSNRQNIPMTLCLTLVPPPLRGPVLDTDSLLFVGVAIASLCRRPDTSIFEALSLLDDRRTDGNIPQDHETRDDSVKVCQKYKNVALNAPSLLLSFLMFEEAQPIWRVEP